MARGYVGERIMAMAEVNLLRDVQFASFLQNAKLRGENPFPRLDHSIGRRVVTWAFRNGLDPAKHKWSRGPGAAAMGGRFVGMGAAAVK